MDGVYVVDSQEKLLPSSNFLISVFLQDQSQVFLLFHSLKDTQRNQTSLIERQTKTKQKQETNKKQKQRIQGTYNIKAEPK